MSLMSIIMAWGTWTMPTSCETSTGWTPGCAILNGGIHCFGGVSKCWWWMHIRFIAVFMKLLEQLHWATTSFTRTACLRRWTRTAMGGKAWTEMWIMSSPPFQQRQESQVEGHHGRGALMTALYILRKDITGSAWTAMWPIGRPPHHNTTRQPWLTANSISGHVDCRWGRILPIVRSVMLHSALTAMLYFTQHTISRVKKSHYVRKWMHEVRKSDDQFKYVLTSI